MHTKSLLRILAVIGYAVSAHGTAAERDAWPEAPPVVRASDASADDARRYDPGVAPEEIQWLTKRIVQGPEAEQIHLYQGIPTVLDSFAVLPDYRHEGNSPFYRCFWSHDNGRTFEQLGLSKCTETNGRLEISCKARPSFAVPPYLRSQGVPIGDILGNAQFRPARADALALGVADEVQRYVVNGREHFAVELGNHFPYRLGESSPLIRENRYKHLFIGLPGAMAETEPRRIGYRSEMDCRQCDVFFVKEGKFWMSGSQSQYFPDGEDDPPPTGLRLHTPRTIPLVTDERTRALTGLLRRYGDGETLSTKEMTVLETTLGPAPLRAIRPRREPDPCDVPVHSPLASGVAGATGNH